MKGKWTEQVKQPMKMEGNVLGARSIKYVSVKSKEWQKEQWALSGSQQTTHGLNQTL